MKFRSVFFTSLALQTLSTVAYAQVAPGQPIPRSDPNGVYCREYTQPVVIGGKRVASYGTACQQPDGSWRIISNNQQQQPDIEYLDEPQYISPPQYVAPPVAYYYPQPAYYPAPYPYYSSGVSIGFGFGGGWGYGHHWHGHHGGGGHHH